MLAQFTLRPESVILYNGLPLIIIKANGLCVPIVVGGYEACAIQHELQGIETPRPMTHDLMKNMLIGLGMPIAKIVLTEFRGDEEIYIASLFVEKQDELVEFDCRPSDAIALAVRFGAPMFIEESALLATLDREETKTFLEFIEAKLPAAMQPETEE